MARLPGQILADHTTLRVGGPADAWVTATSGSELRDVVRELDASGTPVLILGGGSNLLVDDAGFRGTVVQVATGGVDLIAEASDDVVIRVAAGECWDDLVAQAVAQGWAGVEALSGIPGLVGATPVQNVGAYGQEVAQVVEVVRALDRVTGHEVDLAADVCGFGYRTSRFKDEPDRWLILGVDLRLPRSSSGRVTYPELARDLGVQIGDAAPLADVRTAVLGLRAGKGMVLDADDHDTWSAGSFFTNPIVPVDVAMALPEECPRYPAEAGVKLSAAWLIARAGIERGFAIDESSRARISMRHTLALTNRGSASAEDVLDLARAVRSRVRDTFGITLEPEVRLVNCSL